MPLKLDVAAKLDEAALEKVTKQIRIAVYQAIVDGVADALGAIGKQTVVNFNASVDGDPE
jgi:hypothetical protein